MLRKSLAIVATVLLLLSAYLCLWPVPVEPVSWDAPADRGYVDPFARNDRLAAASGIDLGEYHGPEDATLGHDNRIYVTTDDGLLIRLQNRAVSPFATLGGRPLGIETATDGALVVANAIDGIQRVDDDGNVDVILDSIDGDALVNANNLAIGPDGVIYFSQSSTKFTTDRYGGSYAASLLDILEHGSHGNVFAFDPATGAAERIMTGLNYANGVAVSDDGSFLLVAETGHYRVWKYWLAGVSRGQAEVIVDNLPGFPDNIKSGLNGRFWVGLVAPRNALLDRVSDKPFVRKVVQRLPAGLRPAAEPSSHVIAIDGDGNVLMNLYDPSARFAALTGVLETRDSLYLTSLFGRQLARLEKRDL